MALSLREQLLKAGLVNQKQAKQAEKQQKKQKHLVEKGQQEVFEKNAAAKQAQAEKAARDLELNRIQQEKAQQKAQAAQIKQLIEHSRLPKLTGDDYYNFVDHKKVKRIAVNPAVRDKLSRGQLAIVRNGGSYEIIPREAALKIVERDKGRVILLNQPSGAAPEADDPYAAYQIPDDLMW